MLDIVRGMQKLYVIQVDGGLSTLNRRPSQKDFGAYKHAMVKDPKVKTLTFPWLFLDAQSVGAPCDILCGTHVTF